MSIIESLLVSINGISIVFIVLITLSFLLMLQSKIIGSVVKKYNSKETVEEVDLNKDGAQESVVNATSGELKLLGVDERTAAMIMAIVSDESKIPLSELQFKSIKAID